MLSFKRMTTLRRFLRNRDVRRLGLRQLDNLQQQRFAVGAALGAARHAVAIFVEQGQQRLGDLPDQLARRSFDN